ncbi:hypothetical protein TWF694_005319 [Orbilia ellipsospora]|uniref:Geranylgeranyl pyrophosphate synthase n=1 Tax=Orbilia ellipsospora TaxID=2528407 RepID=A0AAV9WYU3_9PEZI
MASTSAPIDFDLRHFGVDPDLTSSIQDFSSIDTQGLLKGYTLRKTKWPEEVAKGVADCHRDWEAFVGPRTTYGSENSRFGLYTEFGLPLLRKDRLRLCSYIYEFAFLYDSDVVERIQEQGTLDVTSDMANLAINGIANAGAANHSATGTKQLYSKMLLEMMETDPACGQWVLDCWQEMIATSVDGNQAKFKDPETWEEFYAHRLVDGGVYWSGSVMLYGMGIALTPEETKLAHDVLHDLFISLCLANDCYSFDEEYRTFLESGEKKMSSNAVWFFMQTEGMDVESAKKATIKRTIEHEAKAIEARADFIKICKPEQAKVLHYTEQYWYVPAVNVLWSMSCPRYNRKYRPKGGPEQVSEKDSKGRVGTSSVPKTRWYQWTRRFMNKLSPQTMRARSSERKVELEEQTRPSLHEEGNIISHTSSTVVSNDSRPQSLPSSISSAPSKGSHPKENSANLGDELLLAPYDYLTSMPSKGVRETFVDALDLFYQAPPDALTQVKSIGRILHTASIMLDDMEDNSPLRRGKDAAHIVYGTPQAINSSNYLIVWAMNEVSKLRNPTCLNVLFEELRNSLIGQSFEMKWRDERICPTEEEYIDMVEKKTGGLFRFLARLVHSMGTKNSNLDPDHFAYILGQYFQIRDDYMNLTDTNYTDQKGFCEDLDEGKFSYLIVHAWNSAGGKRLQELFESRGRTGSMTREEKLEALGILRDAGSFEYTERRMGYLHAELEGEIKRFEEAIGLQNWSLRYMLHKLAKRT